MKTIIAGSRGIRDYDCICRAIADSGFPVTHVLSGAAAGVDALGERRARENGVSCRRYPAEWSRRGRGAGFFRNERMARDAEALIAVWDGSSRSTAHMIETAQQKRLKIFVAGPVDFSSEPPR